MSQVSDAFSGGSSGASDATGASAFGDTPNLTNSDFAGLTDADIMGGGSGSGGFSSFSNIMNALSGGGSGAASSTGSQAAAMSPPPAAAGGDPVGAASGTQSATTPGSTPANQNQGGGGSGSGAQTQQDDGQHAPASAVAELRTLLKGLSGQPTGPTGQIPQAAAISPLGALAGSSPAEARLPPMAARETSPQSPGPGAGFPGSQPGGGADIPPQITAAGTPAADTPLPPPRPQDGVQVSSLGDDPAGDQTQFGGGKRRDSAVTPKPVPATQAMPFPQNEPGEVAPGGPALPTHKPTQPEAEPPASAPATAAAPAAAPAPSRLIQDITGASTGSPTALADLAKVIVPLLPMLLGGLMGGGGGRRGHFRGGGFGRFGGYRGGMNAMHYHGGRHPGAPGAWPYHHPQFGWHMHGRPPGPGWLPLNPMDAQALVGGGGQGGQPAQAGGAAGGGSGSGGAGGGQPDDAFQKSGFSANPFIDALVGQESRGGQNIVSDTDKDSRGLTRAQGGNPNEISQGYFQIQNHPGGTWDTYARQAGVDLNKYPSPMKAPLDVQWKVAQLIPIGQWGGATKAVLRQKFGNFDPNMPFGQVAAKYGPAGGRLAAQTPSRTQPAWAAASPPPSSLPVTSQPMVAGGP